MSKQRGEAKETKEKCVECGKISGCDSWLSCEVCDGWYHAKCVGIKEEAYKVLQELETCHWFCSGCNVKVGKIIPNLVRLNDRVVEVDKRVSKVEVELTACNENVGKMKDEMFGRVAKLETEMMSMHVNLTTMKEEVKKSDQDNDWSEVVKREVNKSLETVTDDIQAVQHTLTETRAHATEMRDKESRRNNVIIYKVPESTAPRAEDRNKEDVSFCLQLFNNCLNVGIVEEDFVNVFRLGRPVDNAPPRPLMVQLATYTMKNLVMESLFKLKQAERKFKGVVVAHDMTRAERDECKKKVGEAKALEEDDPSGEYLYRVRGSPGQMRIIKIRRRH